MVYRVILTGLDTSKWKVHIDDSDKSVTVKNGHLKLYEKGDNDGVWIDSIKIFTTHTYSTGYLEISSARKFSVFPWWLTVHKKNRY